MLGFGTIKLAKRKELFPTFGICLCAVQFLHEAKTEKRFFLHNINRSFMFMSDIGDKQWCNKQVQKDGS